MLERLIGDHDNTAPQMRKPFSLKDAMAIHQAGGCFLHFLAILQKMAPATMFKEAEKSLRDQFAQGFMDGDLLHVITTSVPPADIKAIGSFRTDFVVGFLCNMSFVGVFVRCALCLHMLMVENFELLYSI